MKHDSSVPSEIHPANPSGKKGYFNDETVGGDVHTFGDGAVVMTPFSPVPTVAAVSQEISLSARLGVNCTFSLQAPGASLKTAASNSSYWAIAMSGDVSKVYNIFSQWPVRLCAIVSCKNGVSAEDCLREPWLTPGSLISTASVQMVSPSSSPPEFTPFALAMGEGLGSLLAPGRCEKSGNSEVGPFTCDTRGEGIVSVGLLEIGRNPL